MELRNLSRWRRLGLLCTQSRPGETQGSSTQVRRIEGRGLGQYGRVSHIRCLEESTVFQEYTPFRVLQDRDGARFTVSRFPSRLTMAARYRFASIHDTPKATSVTASMDTVVISAMRMYPSPIMSPPVGRMPVRTGM